MDDGFQLLGERRMGLSVVVEGEARRIEVAWDARGPSVAPGFDEARDYVIVEADGAVIVLHDGRQTRMSLHDPFAVDLDHMDEGSAVKAPMHGKVVAVFVAPGDRVEKGQRLAIVEAMKMEHVLVARAGEIRRLRSTPATGRRGGPVVVIADDDGELEQGRGPPGNLSRIPSLLCFDANCSDQPASTPCCNGRWRSLSRLMTATGSPVRPAGRAGEFADAAAGSVAPFRRVGLCARVLFHTLPDHGTGRRAATR